MSSRSGRQPHAFVHLHGDVGAEQPLHLDRTLRRQFDLGAVDMRAEGHGVLADLAQFRQRHHLEAAGVRQHRTVPAGEMLQAAERGDALGARPQHQMIGIAEHDIGAGIAHLAPVHALHRARRADRHEGRRPHHAMRRGQPAGAGIAVGREQFEMVGKAHGTAYGATRRTGFNLVEGNFRRQSPLTAAKLSRISPRHDDDHQTHHENHEALRGLGRRARVVERPHH